ncbi:hypothetical protein T492DRAFT_995863 [Pavlovales sp. CCMP2436]|nr:hypothetical protein T492DRAFT_995863 [Pavlovales sp. CCMP2436]
MRALDLVLEEVTAAYARRAALLSPMVDTLLSRLVADVSPYSAEGLGLNNISMLLPLRDSLNGFELEATELIGVLVGLLDSDEDMLDMLLTEKAALRGKRPPAAHHEPVELLLEEYARQMATVLTEAQALKKRVASASELAQLHLDISRNRMVSMNVHLSMVNTSLALIMTSAGVFGMNLTSGMENSSDAFYAVTAISSLAAGCTLATCWSYLHGFRGSGRSQQLSLQLQSSNAVRRVFRNLDSLQFVLANKLGPTPSSLPDEGAGAGGGGAGTEDGAAAPGAAVSVASLKRELEHASGHTMSSAELTLLLRLLEREDIHDAPVPRSQIAALWQRFALPREMWSPSEPSPLARPPALDGKKAPAAGAPPVAGAATAHGVPPAAPPAGKLPGKK